MNGDNQNSNIPQNPYNPPETFVPNVSETIAYRINNHVPPQPAPRRISTLSPEVIYHNIIYYFEVYL